MVNRDFETAVAMALEEEQSWDLCPLCGAMMLNVRDHVCRTAPLQFEGMERDDKRRAKSYAVE